MFQTSQSIMLYDDSLKFQNLNSKAQLLMPRLLLIVFSLSVLLSCKHNNSTYSGDHLSREMMEKVLLDINLAEAYSISAKDSVHKPGTKNMDSLSAFYKRVFDHYKITDAEFNSSLEWYKGHPEELDSVYAHIIPLANNLQAKLPVPKTAPPLAAAPPGLPTPQQPARPPAPVPQRPAGLQTKLLKGTPHPVPQRSVDNSKRN